MVTAGNGVFEEDEQSKKSNGSGTPKTPKKDKKKEKSPEPEEEEEQDVSEGESVWRVLELWQTHKNWRDAKHFFLG